MAGISAIGEIVKVSSRQVRRHGRRHGEQALHTRRNLLHGDGSPQGMPVFVLRLSFREDRGVLREEVSLSSVVASEEKSSIPVSILPGHGVVVSRLSLSGVS